jgi:hypothetical protein
MMFHYTGEVVNPRQLGSVSAGPSLKHKMNKLIEILKLIRKKKIRFQQIKTPEMKKLENLKNP